MEEDSKLKEPVFKELQAEDPDLAPTQVESLCVNCGENVSLLRQHITLNYGLSQPNM